MSTPIRMGRLFLKARVVLKSACFCAFKFVVFTVGLRFLLSELLSEARWLLVLHIYFGTFATTDLIVKSPENDL